VPQGVRVMRSVTFADAMAKARWIDSMATLDGRFEDVQKISRLFNRAYGPNDKEPIARALHRFVRDGIKYVEDPNGEQLSDSVQILRDACGDCDDKARLYVALVRAARINSRILPIFQGPAFTHVQAQTWLGGRWLVSELIVHGCELGDLPPRGRQILA
jgi:hypothetical protein